MVKKKICSADGRLAIPYDEVTHVCITPSIHALLQYLLLFDKDTVANHTAYFLGYAVPTEVASHLAAVRVSFGQTGEKMSLRRALCKFRDRLLCSWKFPFIKSAQVFAFDVGFAPSFIGKCKYALLSDGPLGISQNMQLKSVEYQRQLKRSHTLRGKMEELLYGPVAVFGWGNNPQCTAFYLTEDNDAVVFKDKPVYIKSMERMWADASSESRAFVKHVFSVGKDDISLLSSRHCMFLTQPMVDDQILSESEYVDILKKIFHCYGEENLLLKLHPRDRFDYRKYFPQVAIYDKKVNMQLLVLLGASVDRAITICSSSINSFPESVEADWYGSDIHPRLKAHFGKMVPPYRKYNQMAL